MHIIKNVLSVLSLALLLYKCEKRHYIHKDWFTYRGFLLLAICMAAKYDGRYLLKVWKKSVLYDDLLFSQHRSTRTFLLIFR